MAPGLLFSPSQGFFADTSHVQDHKPSWWIILVDVKSDRLVVPPLKVTDVPFTDPSSVRDYRSYKLKFQAPAGTGLFTWRVMVVSDTYIAEDGAKDLQVCYSYNIFIVVITDARLVTRGRIHGIECRRAT
jgi:preprotein translocase subunit Sec63